ncbi:MULTISPECIES: YgiW/YdeI family stress tolerance OB fold protein [Aeromonas]|uniref:NirD/YgiW/YdeI family stress tolerance protein n=1 Tax=Aeromonas rivipollensis TaxID=948519 RepID=A0AAP6SZ30_9GAMM|nr:MULTISPECIES: NirD/YgiW/YdeI family stress tolerance protein [Aeromonas]MBP8269458.1 NirD/YgiW/YdeI family stress tolerance protein [Aeromonas sp.]QIY87694.1 NirD/YgiW/YdeI family stress tolerance protein [Aeromonas hydrophila]AVP92938.1 DNA-binding protein [Aeromonas rivipollensis]MBS4700328.1 NirD/YgiW/YdeI family stress tolerance protein [Aeromonas media]MCE9924176.1 NirD/YgiW/YdeI family stress tolerance protein [Aeromonas media]
MNKAKVIGLVALMSVSSFAMAAYTGPQEQNKVSVAQLKDVADDQWVTLEGKLVKHLGGENYTFRDESGEVEVEVDGDVWRGVEVGPNDLIRIRGEVDHSWNKTEVEVEHLEKVGAAPQSKGGFIAK